MMKRSIISLFCLLVAILPAAAQEFRATVNGRVTDVAGAAIVNATVTVRNLATNELAVVTTNSEGAYNVPFLKPGIYLIRLKVNNQILIQKFIKL